jgi:nucleoside-diphosphate-sugar epimerase
MKVLVTGGSGRLGPFVIDELLSHGHEVRLFSRRPVAERFAKLPLVQGDINNYEDCVRAMQSGVQAVQHLAAQPWPVDHPRERQAAEQRGIPFDATMRSNIMGLYYLLQAALQQGVETFVLCGSNCALGHGYRISSRPFPFHYLPVDEQHPSEVEDSYSYSKLAGEELLASFTRSYGMRTYSVRAAGICDETRRRGIAEQARRVTGWSDWLWAWVGSEDVASAHRLLMEKAGSIPAHDVFFCNGDDTTAREPSLELVERFRPDLLPLVRGLPGSSSFLSNQHLKDVVGWQHATSWREYLS